jgi:hypothetical protein
MFRKSKKISLSLLATVCLTLTACGGGTLLQDDYEDYAAAYADSSNGQMLMNLARRYNGHPPYFLQLAAISASHQHSATAVAGYSRTSARGGVLAASPALSAVISPSVSLNATQAPVFSFAPLAGASFASAVLQPAGANVFFSMLAQGQPANILMRTMVQQVTFTWASKERKVLLNVVPDEHRVDAFRNFLRLAGAMRELQKRGLVEIHTDGLSFPDGMKGMFELISSDPERYNFLEGMKFENIQGVPEIKFGFRTFDAMLTALATEQDVFDLLATSHGNEFLNKIPTSEAQPILRTKWGSIDAPTTAPTVRVEYRGDIYEVKDVIRDDPNTVGIERNRWNRDSFNLLTDMFSVIAIDPNKLPAQQLIQVR